MDNLLDRFGGRVLIADGAMGTLLHDGSGHSGAPPEEILLTNTGFVSRAHSEYASAGADILTTNTYGAGRMKLREFGLEARQEEIVERAVEAARIGRNNRNCIIAGSIGPLGSFLEPFGPVKTAEAAECFRELASLLSANGVDCIALETFTDIRELRIAVMAVRSVSATMPVIMSMSFDRGVRTVTGTPPEVLSDVAGAFGPGYSGVNCGASLSDNEAAVLSLLSSSSLPVSYQPNAGIPALESGVAAWPASPDDLAASALKVCRAGAAIAGSCCGSTPDHTRAIAAALSGMKVSKERPRRACSMSSRTTLISFGNRFIITGERINPTGKPRLARSIRDGSTGLLKKYAVLQAASGAQALDLNIGVGDPSLESGFMPGAVSALDRVTSLPFFIDSPLPPVISAGLSEYPARTIVNSIPCIGSRLEAGLPMIGRHGAGFIALLMDERGVPETVRERMALLDRILAAASVFGLGSGDMLVDPVVLAEAASPGASRTTLEVIREIREHYGLHTILGLSNVSFGLPARKSINRAFLVQATSCGLAAAIMDPADSDQGLLPEAARLLSSTGCSFPAFAMIAAGMDESLQTGVSPETTACGSPIENALMSGDPEEAARAVRDALIRIPPSELVSSVLIPAVTRLGREYEDGRLFLPQLLAGAEAVKACFDAIREVSGSAADRGTILMATVEGDVHDIGKNIVAAIFAGHGWRIVDLGRNVPSDRIVAEASMVKPDAIGLSALLTPSLPVMEKTVRDLQRELHPVPVIILGGAVVTRQFASTLGVLYGKDGIQGAEALDHELKAGG